MLLDEILYTGSNITDANGNPLLNNNTIYRIEEPWDFSSTNILTLSTLDNKWIFFIYDESGGTKPRGYELELKYIQHPRAKIIQDIIES